MKHPLCNEILETSIARLAVGQGLEGRPVGHPWSRSSRMGAARKFGTSRPELHAELGAPGSDLGNLV